MKKVSRVVVHEVVKPRTRCSSRCYHHPSSVMTILRSCNNNNSRNHNHNHPSRSSRISSSLLSSKMAMLLLMATTTRSFKRTATRALMLEIAISSETIKIIQHRRRLKAPLIAWTMLLSIITISQLPISSSHCQAPTLSSKQASRKWTNKNVHPPVQATLST